MGGPPTVATVGGPRPTGPIGVFDSGVGGLTVLSALRRLLPDESYLYLGDTARVPYGPKSPTTITRYALETSLFLLQRGVKAMVVACHSVSSICLDTLVQHFRVPVVGVIEPACREALRASRTAVIGVIGTRATVGSGTYERTLESIEPRVRVVSAACPLLVPLVEEGLLDHAATHILIGEYIEPLRRQGADTLLLGCTHYPLLAPTIASVIGDGLALVDSGPPTAAALARTLETRGLLAPSGGRGSVTVCLTDVQPRFAAVAQAFMGEPLDDVTIVTL